MPWKYLRITRRCTCDTSASEEEEINTWRRLSGFEPPRFCHVAQATEKGAAY